jgi:hypothetical protein
VIEDWYWGVCKRLNPTAEPAARTTTRMINHARVQRIRKISVREIT